MLTMTISKTKLLPKEIWEISQEISRNYAPIATSQSSKFRPKTTLSPKEMLEISQEITRKYPLTLSSRKHNLVLLPIDPHHLYAAWRLQPNTTTTDNPTDKTVLRIYPHADQSSEPNPAKQWFDIVVDNSETRQTINLPTEINANYYSAVIGKQSSKNDIAIFATSKVVHLPHSRYISPLCANSAHLNKDAV